MTYSIVAWDELTGMTGVAVATKHLAVGSLVPHARPGVGAVATQANTNPYLGYWGLDRLEEFQSTSSHRGASEVLDSLLQDDPGREGRQVHLVDSRGRTAAWTGRDCAGHAGHLCCDGFSVAGNYLPGNDPLDAMAESYHKALQRGEPFEQRLLLALRACESSGGDVRGRQSASLLVMHQERYPLFDFRVDHHPDPLDALEKVLAQTRLSYYLDFRATLPTDAAVAADRSAAMRPHHPILEPIHQSEPQPAAPARQAPHRSPLAA